MSQQKIIVSVTNDLTTDQRVAKICNTLLEQNYEVLLIGRKLSDSIAIQRNYPTKRFKLCFNKGPLFYLNYNIRLFFFLLFNKADVLWSNDLDTLLSNFLISKIKGVKLIFDSHEYFTEVPELVNRSKKQAVWKQLERKILPQLNNVVTVSPSIASLYRKEYGVDVKVLRNVPMLNKENIEVENIKMEGKKIVIYQGAINVNRGIELMVEAMLYLENTQLYILGKGDIENQISELVKDKKLQEKVKMLGAIPLEKLHGYTQQADLGLSLEESKGLNYQYALPNKLFDYIHAGIPVLVADLPEMAEVVHQYEVGVVLKQHEAKYLAETIKKMLADEEKMNQWKQNAKKAAQELNWEKEQQVIINLLNA
ncbi:MAG: glycosyltransferase [Vicingus serpentipes]|nr:glycosyltransferase [Vicingus serpentipes]